MGEFQADKYTGRFLNNPSRQYSQMHAQLGCYPDITLHKCDYITYSDCALFGNYLMGNEVFGEQVKFMSQFVLTEYACDLPYVELVRAKNQYFNRLLVDGQSSKT